MTKYIKNQSSIDALEPEQYRVTQENGTEHPGTGKYLDNTEPGIYVDIVSGEPLFVSADKFDSGCGWPSFSQPVKDTFINEIKDSTLGMVRTEVRSQNGDSHLGHVFEDGPSETGGLRYCINSASLKFIHIDNMASEGYQQYIDQVEGKKIMAQEKAILAGGCFWGMQDLIRKLDGVISTRVGYTGGEVEHATYQNHDGHAEALEIVFDNDVISYRNILSLFFQIHDPSTLDRQGNDSGTSYRSEIFYTNNGQKTMALKTIADVNASGLWPAPAVTRVTAASAFWQAETEHQDYLQRIPNGYTCHFPRPDWVLEES